MGGRVRGVICVRVRGSESMIGYRLLAPELRGALSWGNAFLLREGAREALAVGAQTARFDARPDEHAGTRLLAQQCGAELLERRLMMVRGECEMGNWRERFVPPSGNNMEACVRFGLR